MRRDNILREIANLDEEINRVIGATELPKLDARPFPLGTWIFAAMCFGWAEFGSMIPGAFHYHLQTGAYAWYLGLIMAGVAFLSTLSWLLRGRGDHNKSDAYYTASRKARVLQEQRQELQAELRAISGE